MTEKLNSLPQIAQGNGGTISFIHKYWRVSCDLDTMLDVGETTCNKIDLYSALLKPGVWNK